MRDVVVVGGGPTGSYIGRELAEKGFDVKILEEHSEIGRPMCCAGILGVESLKKVGLDIRPWALSELTAGTFNFPGKGPITLSRNQTEAVVIDRAKFDEHLAEEAARTGAEIQLKSKCRRVISDEEEVILEVDVGGKKEKIESRMVIGADGTNSVVARSCGLMKEFSPLVCAQAEIPGRTDTKAANVYFNNNFSKAFFGWMVPAGDVYRVGVADEKGNVEKKLSRLIDSISFSDNSRKKIVHYTRDLIPKPNGRLIHDSNRVMLVGDAAGQVKPLTGGGLYMGISCAKIASEITEKALSEGPSEDLLERYENRVEGKFGMEFSIGLRVRNMLKSMSNEDLADFSELLENQEIQEIIFENLDFDHHSNILKALIGRGPKLIKSLGTRKVLKYLNWFSSL